MLKNFIDWLIPGHKQTRVCCFHFGRCGSTLLGNMLNAHSQLNWKSEIFHSLHENSRSNTKNADGIEILNSILEESATKKHLGIETKFQHLDSNGLDMELEDFLSLLGQLNFTKFIVLSRRNYLRQAISVARGQMTKTWHVTSSGELPDDSPFEFDLEQVSLGGTNRTLLDCFEFLNTTYDKAIGLFQSLGLDVLKLEYESDLEQDASIGFRKTVSFLGIRNEAPRISLRKLEQRPVSEIVANFSDIKRALANTPYEWMCQEA